MRTFLLICLIMVFGLIFVRSLPNLLFSSCRLENHRSVPILDTDWVASTRSSVCGSSEGVGTELDVEIKNSKTGASIVAASGLGVSEISLTSMNSRELNIVVPNHSPSRLFYVDIPNVRVSWSFSPLSDPIDRAHFLAWYWGDPKDERNRVWYCAHIFQKIPLSTRDFYDHVMAWDVYGKNPEKTKYCLQ